MAVSAFGVDHGGEVSKSAKGYLAGPLIGAKKGQKGAAYKQSVKSTYASGAKGLGAGAAAGAALGAVAGGKAGAKVGALVGGAGGADVGLIHGSLKGYRKNQAAGRMKPGF